MGAIKIVLASFCLYSVAVGESVDFPDLTNEAPHLQSEAAPTSCPPLNLALAPQPNLDWEVASTDVAPNPSSKAMPPTLPDVSDRWRFEISPYAWIPNLNGSLAVNERGSEFGLEMSDVADLIDETEMMAFLNLKAKKNRTSFFIDFIYSEMNHISTGDLNLSLPANVRTDLDLTWEQLFLQFGAGYTVCEFATPAGRKASLDLQGGGRYLYVAGNDEIVGGPNDRIRIGIDGSENFIEPWIGAMLETELAPCTTLLLGGDIGGFGHGEAVGTNWQYYAKLQYHVTPQLSLDAGYRHMDLKYEDSLGGRNFRFEQEVYGPTVGMTFKF